MQKEATVRRIPFTGKATHQSRAESGGLTSTSCRPKTPNRYLPVDPLARRRQRADWDSKLDTFLRFICVATLVHVTWCLLWPGMVLAVVNHPVPYITSISPVSVDTLWPGPSRRRPRQRLAGSGYPALGWHAEFVCHDGWWRRGHSTHSPLEYSRYPSRLSAHSPQQWR
jgi:hypothetical protein